jgi:cytochrome c
LEEKMLKAKAIAVLGISAAIVAACSDGSVSQPEQVALAEKPVALAASDVTTLDGTMLQNFAGNAANGKAVFAQCSMCHAMDAGLNKIGPSLNGVIGRKSGSVAGFSYSAANANSGFVWTKEKLNQHLEKPQRVIPGTKMIYAGLPDAQKRADVIAYLEAPN